MPSFFFKNNSGYAEFKVFVFIQTTINEVAYNIFNVSFCDILIQSLDLQYLIISYKYINKKLEIWAIIMLWTEKRATSP